MGTANEKGIVTSFNPFVKLRVLTAALALRMRNTIQASPKDTCSYEMALAKLSDRPVSLVPHLFEWLMSTELDD